MTSHKFINSEFGMNSITSFRCGTHQNLNRCPDIYPVVNAGKRRLQPIRSNDERRCTILITQNLAEPEWITVECKQRLLNSIWCQVEEEIRFEESSNLDKYEYCFSWYVALENKCLLFEKYKNSTVKCKDMDVLSFQDMRPFQTLIHAVSFSLPPFLSPALEVNKTTKEYKYEKLATHIKYEERILQEPDPNSYFVCMAYKVHHLTGLNLFHCSNRAHISPRYLCNGKPDCPGAIQSDELLQLCKYINELSGIFQSLTVIENINMSAWLSQDTSNNRQKQNVCNKMSSNNTNNSNMPLFSLGSPDWPKMDNTVSSLLLFYSSGNKSQEISLDTTPRNLLFDDLMPDFLSTRKDETKLEELLSCGKYFPCQRSHQIPCLFGHPKCFNISEICMFSIDIFHHLAPCRNGGHLNNCTEFQCDSTYKCYLSYCVPWSYVCNDRWDCPHGDDEKTNCQNHSFCEHLFKCMGMETTLHSSQKYL